MILKNGLGIVFLTLFNFQEHILLLIIFFMKKILLRILAFRLKEEKMKLSEMSHDYEEVNSRLLVAESELQQARRDLDLSGRQVKLLEHNIEKLENDVSINVIYS